MRARLGGNVPGSAAEAMGASGSGSARQACVFAGECQSIASLGHFEEQSVLLVTPDVRV
jgi:hypothetical protein